MKRLISTAPTSVIVVGGLVGVTLCASASFSMTVSETKWTKTIIAPVRRDKNGSRDLGYRHIQHIRYAKNGTGDGGPGRLSPSPPALRQAAAWNASPVQTNGREISANSLFSQATWGEAPLTRADPH